MRKGRVWKYLIYLIVKVRIHESKWIEPQKEHIVFGWFFFQGGGTILKYDTSICFKKVTYMEIQSLLLC